MPAINTNTTSVSSLPAIVQRDAGEIFSGKASGVMVEMFAEPSVFTPRPSGTFIMPEWGLDVVTWFVRLRKPLYVSGPSGCGKTRTIKQIAAMLNMPVHELTGNATLEPCDLIGSMTLRADGHGGTETVWVDGPLTRAMREGGVFLLNEMDLLDPSLAAGLNTVLDGSPLCVAANGGELVEPHPLFRFVATANTVGDGEDSGVYTGTMRQNFALMNRFMHVRADYLSMAMERRLLDSRYRSKLPSAVLDALGEFARVVRDSYKGTASRDYDYQNLAVPMPTRSVLDMAELCYVFEPLSRRGVNVFEKAMLMAFGNACDAATRSTLCEIAQRVFTSDMSETA